MWPEACLNISPLLEAPEFGDAAPQVVKELVSGERSAPAPVLPRVKFFTDGAFYSQTMRLSPPGYIKGQSKGTKGLWVTEPGDLFPAMKPYLEAGLAAHVHSNGDAAQGETLKAFKQARDAGLSNDFVIEHAALFQPDHVNLAKETGTMISAASHYVHYMGYTNLPAFAENFGASLHPLAALNEPLYQIEDTKEGAKETKLTFVHPDGTERVVMRPPKTEIQTVKFLKPIAIPLHSDAPLAPPDPLLAASRHVTRMAREGRPYEKDEALSPDAALDAITLDAAAVLGLEDKIGSIEVGKTADFTVLELSPLLVDPEDWGKIEIWGVVLDGELRPVSK